MKIRSAKKVTTLISLAFLGTLVAQVCRTEFRFTNCLKEVRDEVS